MKTVLKHANRHRATPARAAALTAAAALLLAGCSTDNGGDAETTTTAATSAVSSTAAATSSTSPSSSTTAASTTTTAASSTTAAAASSTTSTSAQTSSRKTSATTSAAAGDTPESRVDYVAEHFATLAPASLFAQLDECTESGITGSYNCSGREVGQFQFFDSESKAASTTQLLTELRSSRVVEDKNERIVGWSVLANSAILTVVDNNSSQVMQQLISTDDVDPKTRIYELGLAEQVGEVSTPGKSASSTSTAAEDTEAAATETSTS